MKKLMKLSVIKQSSGFTLIELVIVIVILGVLATAVSTFIKFGTQVYTEATAREQLISSARFAIERLNREVRNALPNSVDVSGKCLKFTPIIESTIYTDIPVAPEVATDPSIIKVISFKETFDTEWNAIVYPLTTDDVYPLISSDTDKVHGVASIDTTGNEWTITLDNNNVLFAEDSPTQRIYFINDPVEYCLQSDQLLRTDSVNSNVLMAQDISTNNSSFEASPATLQRNAMIKIYFQFEKNNEVISFNNEVQVLNVP